MAEEIVTSPAPLVGYNPPWEPPGQVKLEDVGGQLVNAFAMGVEQNRRRQQVEGQLAKLGLENERLQLQAQHYGDMYDLAQQKLGMQDYWNSQRMGLAYDRLGLAKDALDLRSIVAEDKMANVRDAIAGGNDYFSAVQDIDEEKGTAGWQTKFDQTNRIFSSDISVPNSPAYRMWSRFQNEQDKASKGRADADQRVISNWQRDLNLATKGKNNFTTSEFMLPESAWGIGKDADGNVTRWIAESADRSGQILRWNPKDVYELSTEDQQAHGIQFRTIDGDAYDHLRQGADAINAIEKQHFSSRPGMPSARTRNIKFQSSNGKIYTIPSDQIQEVFNRDPGAHIVP